MSRTHRILWGEGVFLHPHHFQQQERFLEAGIARALAFAQNHPWGADVVELDRDALAGGVLALNRLELTFQDGTWFSAPDQEPLPLARQLDDLPGLGLATLVHAGLPLVDGFGGNAPAEPSGRPVRFKVERVPVPDLFTDALETELTVLRTQARLLLEPESRDGHLALPIARLVRDATGAWAIDDGFLPPLATLAGAPPLLAMLKRLQDILQVKSRTLAEGHRERAHGVLEYGPSDLGTFWLLHTVNRAWPLVGHFLACPRSHPEEVYKALAQLAGELLTFSSARILADIPPYRHLDLAGSFQSLDRLLRELLDTVISSRYALIPLTQARPSFHTARLDGERDCDFYLSVAGARPAAEILETVPLKFKVGSPDDVDRMLNSALPGVGLSHVARTPAAVPVRVGNHYFALEPAGPVFQRMLQARSICIYVPESGPPLKLELIAVFR